MPMIPASNMGCRSAVGFWAAVPVGIDCRIVTILGTEYQWYLWGPVLRDAYQQLVAVQAGWLLSSSIRDKVRWGALVCHPFYTYRPAPL